MKVFNRTTRSLCLGVVLAGAGLVSTAIAAHPAFAHVAVCRRDPIIKLSNGKQINMVATYSADPASVSKVVYSLNVPVGVSITKITYTGLTAGDEQVQFQAKQPAGSYSLSTTVTASRTSFAVSATDSLVSQSTGATLASGTAVGMNNKPVTINLKG